MTRYPSTPWGLRLLQLAALCSLALTAVPYALHAWSLLVFPYDLDPGEGFDVGGASILLSGGHLYGDPRQFPFFQLNYPPGYPLVVAPLLALLGPSVIPGRIVSVAAAAGLALLVFGAGSRRLAEAADPLTPGSTSGGSLSLRSGQAGGSPRAAQTRWFAGALAALAFLASGYVLHVTPLARTTSLMLFLSAAGLFCLERAAQQVPRSRWLPAGLLLLLAAVYTKPVALDAAAAGLGYLVVRRPAGWPQGLATFLLLGLSIHGLLQAISRGQYFDAVFTANAYPFDGDQLFSYTRNVIETHGLLLVVGLTGLAMELSRRQLSPWSFYLGAGLVTAATSGRWGAGESYFLPLVISSCVLGPRALAEADARRPILPALALGALALYPLLAGPGPWPLSFLFPGRDRGFQAQIAYNPGLQDVARGRQIAVFVEAASGPVLSEAAGFLLPSGKALVGNPMLLRGLAAHGLYDATGLIQSLEKRQISRVVLLGQWYPQPVLDAVAANYERVGQVEMNHNSYLLLLPRRV